MRTRPRTPCGAATTPSRTRSPLIKQSPSGRCSLRSSLSRRGRRSGSSSGCRGSFRLHALLRLGAGQALLCLLATLARLHQLGVRQELGDAVRRAGADLEPVSDALLLHGQTLLVLSRQQRVVGAQLLDEAAVARAARVGDDDVVERPLLGAVTGHADR